MFHYDSDRSEQNEGSFPLFFSMSEKTMLKINKASLYFESTMKKTVKDLIQQGYKGCTVRDILTDPEFRQRVLEDKGVRGNDRVKELVMDKLAVGGKVLLTGPTGEAKTLFARLLLDYIVSDVNQKKYHIAGCPFLEDAYYVIEVINNIKANPFASVSVLQSLCPYCRRTIEGILGEEISSEVSVDNIEEIMKVGKKIPVALEKVPVEKTIVRRAQIDPRTDPESLYMLIAGVENLEVLLGGETKETFNPAAHKVGVLSQGFMVVNEIQRLPLSLLEALMGFLEDPQGIKYNLLGQTIYVDGAIIFTSNAPLTVFGEESQPIINRVPEVLWPARSVGERIKIVADMFRDHIVVSRQHVPPNPSVIRLFELAGTDRKDVVSRLAVEFIAHVASESIPQGLQAENVTRAESRKARAEFYAALEEIHNPQKTPHIDLRTLNNAIGEIVIRAEPAFDDAKIITLDSVRATLDNYDIDTRYVNDALQALKMSLRAHIREGKLSISVEDVSADLDRLTSLTPEQLDEIIISYEGLKELDADLKKKVVELLRPSYEQLLSLEFMQ